MKNTAFKNIFLPFLLLIFATPIVVAQDGCCSCFFQSGAVLCSPNVDAANCDIPNCEIIFPTDGPSFFTTHNTAAPSCAGLGCVNIMPIDLKTFEVTFTKQKEVSIEWVTAMELNNKGFEIQRSQDTRRWEVIAFVEGSGDTEEEQFYKLSDRPTFGGLYYYRLHQIDFDGTETFFDIKPVMVEYSREDGIVLYPNPVQDKLLLKLDNEKGQANIYNALGQLMITEFITESITTIAVSNWPQGQYWVRIKLDSGDEVTKMIVK